MRDFIYKICLRNKEHQTLSLYSEFKDQDVPCGLGSPWDPPLCFSLLLPPLGGDCHFQCYAETLAFPPRALCVAFLTR